MPEKKHIQEQSFIKSVAHNPMIAGRDINIAKSKEVLDTPDIKSRLNEVDKKIASRDLDKAKQECDKNSPREELIKDKLTSPLEKIKEANQGFEEGNKLLKNIEPIIKKLLGMLLNIL